MKSRSSFSQQCHPTKVPTEKHTGNADSGWHCIPEHNLTESADKMSDQSHGISKEDLQKFQVMHLN